MESKDVIILETIAQIRAKLRIPELALQERVSYLNLLHGMVDRVPEANRPAFIEEVIGQIRAILIIPELEHYNYINMTNVLLNLLARV